MIYTFEDYSAILEVIRKIEPKETTPHKNINLDDGFVVTPTFHQKTIRKDDERERDYLLDEPTIKKILNKALRNGLKDIPNGQGHLMMKNSIGKWDDFIIVKDGKRIVMKTVMLQDRPRPNFFTKEGDFKLVIESGSLFDFTVYIN